MGIITDDPLSIALFGKTRRRVLNLFFDGTDTSYNVNDVIRELGLGTGAVFRELKNLAEAGILESYSVGNQLRYRVNMSCPIHAELRAMIQKTAGGFEMIREALQPMASEITAAFIYGSYARGNAGPGSDIDLMVVGDADMLEVLKALREISDELGREINPSVFDESEFRNRSGDEGFIKRISEGPRIFLIGSEDELR